MKPLTPPSVPGETEAARIDYAVRTMFGVSKQDFLKRIGETAYSEDRKEAGERAGFQ
jgi:hypothetical protein